MVDGIYPFDCPAKDRHVQDVPAHEGETARSTRAVEKGFLPGGQIIETHDLVPAGQQRVGQVAAHEPGGARYEVLHRRITVTVLRGGFSWPSYISALCPRRCTTTDLCQNKRRAQPQAARDWPKPSNTLQRS